MFRIGNIECRNPIIVGPMAGITNGAFRELCYEFGAGLTYTEMTSDKAICYKNAKTMEMLEIDDAYHPITIQLFGSELDTMVKAAIVMDEDTNADIIDINMGCPVNKVIKTGAGSAMMLDEEKTVKIVEAIVKNVRKPVTAKMRLGYDRRHMNYLSLAQGLEKAGVKAVALHGRTRTQMYEGQADWEPIRILKEHLSIPVIGNGDVKSVEDYLRMKEECNVDAVMISRAVVGNPFLIKEISNVLEGREEIHVGYKERFEYCLSHARKLISLKGEDIAMREMRGLAPHYLSGLYMSTKYKSRMISMRTYEDLETILKEYETLLAER